MILILRSSNTVFSLSLSDDEDLEAMEAEILRGEKPPTVIENVDGDQPAGNKSKGQSTATAGEATADKVDREQASAEIGKVDENGSESSGKLSKKAKKKKKKGAIE